MKPKLRLSLCFSSLKMWEESVWEHLIEVKKEAARSKEPLIPSTLPLDLLPQCTCGFISTLLTEKKSAVYTSRMKWKNSVHHFIFIC